MKTPKKNEARERRWVIFNNGCIHGVQHSEFVVVRSVPHRSVTQDSVAVFTISRTFGLLAALAAFTLLLLVLTGCALPGAQKGGTASSLVSRPGHTTDVKLTQSDNPKEPSRQIVQSEQTIEYVLPAGAEVSLGDRSLALGAWSRSAANPQMGANSSLKTQTPTGAGSWESGGAGAQTPNFYLQTPVPVRSVTKDRTETVIGAAQKDNLREWAGKAAQMRPVIWAGILMMTVVAGLFVYFHWWTKAALAVGVGVGMIVLAQTLPDHGGVILLGGLSLFALIALLVLYAYYKGQVDKDQNGIPDVLERKPQPGTA